MHITLMGLAHKASPNSRPGYTRGKHCLRSYSNLTVHFIKYTGKNTELLARLIGCKGKHTPVSGAK